MLTISKRTRSNGELRLVVTIYDLYSICSAHYQSASHDLGKKGKKGLLDGGHSKVGTIADLGLKRNMAYPGSSVGHSDVSRAWWEEAFWGGS